MKSYLTILELDDAIVDGYIVHDTSALPQWVQERMAVLRLLEPLERSPLGWWVGQFREYDVLYRLRATKEEQEEWLRWKEKDLT